MRYGYITQGDADLDALITNREEKLFKVLLKNPMHVLHEYLPQEKVTKYDICYRRHNLRLPTIQALYAMHNYLLWMLYK